VDVTKVKNLALGRGEGGAAIMVTVVPRASKDEIAGMQGDSIRVRLTAPPVDGAANDALIKFLSKCLGVRQSAIEIVAGHSSRHKLISILGLSPAEVTARLFS
jgi:uncharacterized protein